MYTINEVAELCDVTAHTLRFYDKEGLLPFVSRNKAGNREFSEQALDLVKLICCLKNTAMPVKEIKAYIDLLMSGEQTVESRKQIMLDHRKAVMQQINNLKKNLTIIDLKVAYYLKDETVPSSQV